MAQRVFNEFSCNIIHVCIEVVSKNDNDTFTFTGGKEQEMIMIIARRSAKSLKKWLKTALVNVAAQRATKQNTTTTDQEFFFKPGRYYTYSWYLSIVM